MSKIGKKIIALPAGVEAHLQNKLLTVKGPKGQLSYTLLDGVEVKIEGNEITVAVADEEKRNLR